jgi:hypothetical protein
MNGRRGGRPKKSGRKLKASVWCPIAAAVWRLKLLFAEEIRTPSFALNQKVLHQTGFEPRLGATG